MDNPRTNDDYQSPTDEELRSLIEQMLQDVFEDDEDAFIDHVSGDDPEWTADKEQAEREFPDEAN